VGVGGGFRASWPSWRRPACAGLAARAGTGHCRLLLPTRVPWGQAAVVAGASQPLTLCHSAAGGCCSTTTRWRRASSRRWTWATSTSSGGWRAARGVLGPVQFHMKTTSTRLGIIRARCHALNLAFELVSHRAKRTACTTEHVQALNTVDSPRLRKTNRPGPASVFDTLLRQPASMSMHARLITCLFVVSCWCAFAGALRLFAFPSRVLFDR
jgi:hypothetical protein